MYNDQSAIKKEFEVNLLNKFGEQITNDVLLLIEKVSGKDVYINNNLWLNLQNLLTLQKHQASYFIKLALELSSASAVVPVLLLEKIPTLIFYDIAEEVGGFLSTIKDYGSRAAAYYIGCDQLKIDDLLHILEQSTISFYKTLLSAVNARHVEFGICSSYIMRYAAKIEPVVREQDIAAYLDVCSTLFKNYGVKITEKYISNAYKILSFLPLEKHWVLINDLSKKSLVSVEFFVTYPDLFFSSLAGSQGKIFDFESSSAEDIKNFKVDLLKTEDYLTFLDNPFLFKDEDYLSLMMSWPILKPSVKSNILFQLQKDNYKNYIITHPELEEPRNKINQVTGSKWLDSWMFCGEIIDLSYIRNRMRLMLQDPKKFSIESKSIVKRHQTVFDRSNSVYSGERVLNMLSILLSYCIDEATVHELSAMADFISGHHNSLKNFLSKTTLVVKACERDPWIDYGRSDELFSCTSLGEYNAGNAPAFMADLNLNNLDIWSNGARVGRIHLCLIKDTENNPLLLLDCVDGSERIIESQKKFELVMAAVIEYARWLGLKQIKMNYEVDFNTTPKKFIGYVEQALKGQNKIDYVSRFLTITTANQLIPYPCQTYLESFLKSNGAFVRGALISIQKNVVDNENTLPLSELVMNN